MSVIDYKKIGTTVAITIILGVITTVQGIAFAPQMQTIVDGNEVKIRNIGWAQAKDVKVEITAKEEFNVNISETQCIEGKILPAPKSMKYNFELEQFSTNIDCVIKFYEESDVQKVTITSKDNQGYEWEKKEWYEAISDIFISFIMVVVFLAATIVFIFLIRHFYLLNKTDKENISKNQKIIKKHEQTIQRLKNNIETLELYKDHIPDEIDQTKLIINKLRIKNELLNKYEQKIATIKDNLTEYVDEQKEETTTIEEQPKAETPKIKEAYKKSDIKFSEKFKPKERTVEKAKPEKIMVKISNTDYEIKYETDDRSIDSVQHDPIAQSLRLKFGKVKKENSKLKIFLPKNIIKSEIDSKPEKFFVCFDGEEGFVKELPKEKDTERIISFELDKDTDEVEIIGTELPFLKE